MGAITGLPVGNPVLGAGKYRDFPATGMGTLMQDDTTPIAAGTPIEDSAADAATSGAANRRRVLMLGAAGVAASLTVRPAFAQTAVSVLNCEIPVPAPTNAGQYIAADGSLVAPGTAGAFPPVARPFRGEEVKAALQGRTLPGTSYEQNQAYLNYIRRLRAGQSGFTCFASIQMPR
jgi:hypothetical protein